MNIQHGFCERCNRWKRAYAFSNHDSCRCLDIVDFFALKRSEDEQRQRDKLAKESEPAVHPFFDPAARFGRTNLYTQDQLSRAIEIERERCAKVAERDEFYGCSGQHHIAAAIREGK